MSHSRKVVKLNDAVDVGLQSHFGLEAWMYWGSFTAMTCQAVTARLPEATLAL